MADSKRLTRRECARVLSYASGYLDGKGYRFEYPFLFTSLSAALFDASEQITVVPWQIEQMLLAASAAETFGAADIAAQLQRAADTLATTDTEELARLGIGGWK